MNIKCDLYEWAEANSAGLHRRLGAQKHQFYWDLGTLVETESEMKEQKKSRQFGAIFFDFRVDCLVQILCQALTTLDNGKLYGNPVFKVAHNLTTHIAQRYDASHGGTNIDFNGSA